MQDVEIEENWRVLETSVGTCWNFKGLPLNANFFGLDISSLILLQVQKNIKRWKIPMELFQGMLSTCHLKTDPLTVYSM
jgi:hypothetical protein